MADNKCRNASLLLVEEELLSEEVRCFPCIFDKADKAYKERDTVRNAWDEVAKKLDFLENGKICFLQISVAMCFLPGEHSI